MVDVEIRPSRVHGLGVFAAREFAAGETILMIDDARVVDADHPLRPEVDGPAYHCDYLAAGRVVLMPSPERHINSSCDPSAYVRWVGRNRYVVARRPWAPALRLGTTTLSTATAGRCGNADVVLRGASGLLSRASSSCRVGLGETVGDADGLGDGLADGDGIGDGEGLCPGVACGVPRFCSFLVPIK
jgi:hypothetical protein